MGARVGFPWSIDDEVKVEPSGPAEVASRFLEAFSAADLERMRALLAEDVVAYVTNAEGGLDRVQGRDAYLRRLEAMDLSSARFSIEPTQRPYRWTPTRFW
jgi:ketosteroid isomerase-like protein